MTFRFILPIFLIALITACGESAQESVAQENSEQINIQQSTAAAPTFWQGEAKGYVSSANPNSDITAYLISVSTVDAHLAAYNDSAQGRGIYNISSSEITAVINDELMQTYRSIEEKVLSETSLTRSLEEDINLMISPQYIAALDAGPNERLPGYNALVERFKFWFDGAIEGVEGRNTRVILLAQSALFRKAGDAFSRGIDVKSNTVDPVQENLGYGYFHAALDTSRLIIQYCDIERNALKTIRDEAYELRGKLYEKTAGVGDMYALAAKAENLAEDFSESGDDC